MSAKGRMLPGRSLPRSEHGFALGSFGTSRSESNYVPTHNPAQDWAPEAMMTGVKVMVTVSA